MSTNALIVGEREHATVLVALCFWQSLGQPPLEALSPGSMSDLLSPSELERLINRLERQACSTLDCDDADSRLARLLKPHATSPAQSLVDRQEPSVDLSELVHVHLPYLGSPARAYSFGNYGAQPEPCMDTSDALTCRDAVVELA